MNWCQPTSLQGGSHAWANCVYASLSFRWFSSAWSWCRIGRDAQVEYHLEAGHCLYFYYEAETAAKHFKTAQRLTGLTVELTGRMTKLWQAAIHNLCDYVWSSYMTYRQYLQKRLSVPIGPKFGRTREEKNHKICNCTSCCLIWCMTQCYGAIQVHWANELASSRKMSYSLCSTSREAT